MTETPATPTGDTEDFILQSVIEFLSGERTVMIMHRGDKATCEKMIAMFPREIANPGAPLKSARLEVLPAAEVDASLRAALAKRAKTLPVMLREAADWCAGRQMHTVYSDGDYINLFRMAADRIEELEDRADNYSKIAGILPIPSELERK